MIRKMLLSALPLCFLAFIGLLLSSCAPLTNALYTTPAPYPTYTPYPTLKPLPTYTLAPTYTAYPTQTPLPTYTSLPIEEQIPSLTPTPMRTATPTPSDPQVDIPEWNWFISASGNYVEVQGTVRNISGRPMRFVEIHIIFRDKDENFLGTDYGRAEADVLSPGSLTTWSAFTGKMGDVHYVELSQVLWQWAD